MSIKLTKELLTSEAEKQAKILVQNDKSETTMNQIRKFYNDFLILKNKSDLATDEVFKRDVLPLICFSKAKLAYAYGRGGAKIAKEFIDDINSKIDSIENKNDFNNFINYYQALIGYVTYQAKVKDEERNQNKSSDGFKFNRGNNRR